MDHFVHRFTHRVVRGVLIAMGRPDGRMQSQTSTEAYVLLALMQGKLITNWGHRPETLTVGHNSYKPSAAVDVNLVLPRGRPETLLEQLDMGEAGGRGSGSSSDSEEKGEVNPHQLWAGEGQWQGGDA